MSQYYGDTYKGVAVSSSPLLNSAGAEVGIRYVYADGTAENVWHKPGTAVTSNKTDIRVTTLPKAEEEALAKVFEPSSPVVPLLVAGIAAYTLLS